MEKVLPRHLAFCLLVLLPLESCSVLASGWGRVNMQGAVIETACAIDTESSDQTIDMSLLPLSQIIRDGQGLTRSFRIRLVNCVLGNIDKSQPDWQRFQVTFDGRMDNGFFAVDGQARGIALQLKDSRGNTAFPGEPLPAMSIAEGNRQLNYSLRLVSNLQVLRVGEYTSTIRFKMDYY
ncbi:type 1 fimbrial protein [Serratia sp. 3ACOL1]|jgi:type 1 fimbria pilin|uniref:fimbrial protein n=1 Tax=Serratia sp. 3ACOL1 TaxID=2448483 RepID=UPI000EF4504B|nr:fimbrial protein [Serratia sp. 3ACOL1]AYM92885.1 type 1 fimbrial protein [Serratia sp. 3ACOL1]